MSLRFDKPVLLIGGGPVGRQLFLETQCFTDNVIAADSGAEMAVRYGVDLAAVIGDLDSVTPETLANLAGNYLQDPEQSTTDFEKCLSNIEAPMIIGIGFLGGRIDHELAALNALAKFSTQTVVLLGDEDVIFRCPARLELSLPQNTRVSVFPMGPVSGLDSEGLEYGLEGLVMASEAGIGTSNRASANRQVIEVARGALLVILPRAHLAEAIVALTAT